MRLCQSGRQAGICLHEPVRIMASILGGNMCEPGDMNDRVRLRCEPEKQRRRCQIRNFSDLDLRVLQPFGRTCTCVAEDKQKLFLFPQEVCHQMPADEARCSCNKYTVFSHLIPIPACRSGLPESVCKLACSKPAV